MQLSFMISAFCLVLLTVSCGGGNTSSDGGTDSGLEDANTDSDAENTGTWTCTVDDEDQEVFHSTANNAKPSAVGTPDGVYVVWEEVPPTLDQGDVRLARLSTTQVIATDSSIVVAWSQGADMPSEEMAVRAFNADLQPLSEPTVIPGLPGPTMPPSLAAKGDSVALAWSADADEDIYNPGEGDRVLARHISCSRS